MHHLTKCSLFLELLLNEDSTAPIAIGTGFTIQLKNNENLLITNWHCVTGIHPETGQPLSKHGYTDPQVLRVHFLKKGSTSEWIPKNILLTNDKLEKQYLEHPKGREIDVVAVKIPIYDDVDIFNTFEALIADEFKKQITDTCNIVGFPKGISTAGRFPIWKTGNIASELEIDHDNKPMFLIDASTRSGMSGSPVYCLSKGETTFGTNVFSAHGQTYINFLGIYAGRLGDDIEIGRVFKKSCLDEILIHHYSKPKTIKNIFNSGPTYTIRK